MAKIGFRRLSRGVKFLIEHFYTQIDKALSRFTEAQVLPEDMEQGYSRFSIDFSWGSIQTDLGESGLGSAAFTLPPPQERFQPDGVTSLYDAVYTLESVCASFDQRAEAAAIEADGDLSFDEKDNVAIKIDIWKRRMVTFGGTSDMNDASLVLSLELPNLGFLADKSGLRTNPQVLNGMSEVFDPYSSYVLVVTAPFAPSSVLLDAPNLLVSLNFKAPIIEVDKADDVLHHKVQNMPQVPDLPAGAQYGATYTSPVSADTPAADALIVADSVPGDSGIQGSIELVDNAIKSGLNAGRSMFSRRFGAEGLMYQAGYDVIAVPMWGNGWFVSGATASGDLPYVGIGPGTDPTCDRRIIPIKFPFVVHHVMAYYNYGWNRVTAASFEQQVGVGIGTGERSDSYSYRQVAHATWTGTSYGANVIDRFTGPDVYAAAGVGGDILNIPLVHDATVTGVGYDASVSPALADQGPPFYVGKTNSQDAVRSPAANTPGGAFVAMPSIDGREQFLEVRWSMHDPVLGMYGQAAGETAIGRGGHWVYIIGKKHLC